VLQQKKNIIGLKKTKHIIYSADIIYNIKQTKKNKKNPYENIKKNEKTNNNKRKTTAFF